MVFKVVLCMLVLYGNSLAGSANLDLCSQKLNCRECIQSPDCAWCFQNDFTISITEKCFHKDLKNTKCEPAYILSPKSTVISDSSVIETQPNLQNTSVELRVGNPVTLSLRYIVGSESKVKLDSKPLSGIKTTLTSKCAGNEETTTNQCDNLTIGQVILFKLTLELEKCPEDSHNFSQTMDIATTDVNKGFIINIKLRCLCPCEHPNFETYKPYAPECNGKGDLSCGICNCGKESFGKHCECLKDHNSNFDSCIAPNSTLVCSGRGICICNRCECDITDDSNQRLYGMYCECDNFSCNHYGGKICGGHGKCVCGECICDYSWMGSACEETLD